MGYSRGGVLAGRYLGESRGIVRIDYFLQVRAPDRPEPLPEATEKPGRSLEERGSGKNTQLSD